MDNVDMESISPSEFEPLQSMTEHFILVNRMHGFSIISLLVCIRVAMVL